MVFAGSGVVLVVVVLMVVVVIDCHPSGLSARLAKKD